MTTCDQLEDWWDSRLDVEGGRAAVESPTHEDS